MKYCEYLNHNRQCDNVILIFLLIEYFQEIKSILNKVSNIIFVSVDSYKKYFQLHFYMHMYNCIKNMKIIKKITKKNFEN